MKAFRWHRPSLLALVGLGMAFFVFIFVLPVCFNPFPWGRINSQVFSIDLRTGRIGRDLYLAGVRWQSRIADTVISQNATLPTHDSQRPEWRVMRSQPLLSNYSPCYQYHGVDYAIFQISEAFERVPVTDEAKQLCATTFLRLIQMNEGLMPAKDLAVRLWGRACDPHTAGPNTIDAADMRSILGDYKDSSTD